MTDAATARRRRASGPSSATSSSASCRRSSTGRTSSSRWPTSGRGSRTSWPGRTSPASTWSTRSSSTSWSRSSERLPRAAAIIGLGGGQALDVAKFLAWTRRLPLFQVPTATTVNAPFGHRVRPPRPRPRPLPRLGGPRGRLHRLRRHRVGAAEPQPVRDRRRPLLPHRALRLAARRPARPDRGALAVRPAPRRRRGDRHGLASSTRSTRSGPARRRGSGPSSAPIAGAGRRSTTPAGTRATSRAWTTSSSTTSSGSPAATSSTASRSAWGSSPGPCCRTTSPRRWPPRSPGPASTSGRRRWASPGTTSARRSGRSAATSARPACGSRWPTSCPSTDEHIARVRELVERTFGAWPTLRRERPSGGDAMKLGLTPAPGLRPGVPRRRPGDRLAADRRGRPVGRGPGLRVALGLRPHAGRPAAGGGDRSSSRSPSWRRSPSRRAGRGSATSCSRVVPQPRAHREGDLDDRRDQRRPGDPRDRRRLEGGRVAGLRLRLPAGAASGWPSSPTSSRSSPGCSGRAGRRGRGRTRSVHDAIHEPKGLQQPRIPILVGGNGPKVTWRLAARFADELNLDTLTPAQVEAALPVIRERCEEVGRATRSRSPSRSTSGARPARRRRGTGAAPAVPRLRGSRPGPGDRPGVRPREGPARDRRRRSTTRWPSGCSAGPPSPRRRPGGPRGGASRGVTADRHLRARDVVPRLPRAGPRGRGGGRRRGVARRVAARAADHDRRGERRRRLPPGALGEPDAGQRAGRRHGVQRADRRRPAATSPRPSTTSSCGSPAPATTSSSTCRAPS